MAWLDGLVFWTAAAELLLASASTGRLGLYTLEARSYARRVGAGALAAVNASLALEAAVFLLAARSDLLDAEIAETVALVAVRGALFGATALMSLLVWRQRASRR